MATRSLLTLPIRNHLKQTPLLSRRLHNVPVRPQLRICLARPSPSTSQRRYKGSFRENARTLFKEYPVSMTLAAICIIGGASSLIAVNYIYQTYIIGAFHNYPEPVAQKLRRALYFTNIDLKPKEALKYYKQALQVAEEVGMDPFSDEIIGVKIQVAALMEKLQLLHRAIEVLERVREDNLKWLGLFGDREHNKRKRTNVLAKTVSITVKLGELYGEPAIYDRDLAQERLVWAVETVMKERQRRENLKISEEDEGKWMTVEEEGAALESLAHSYEAKNQHYLAAPLFLQALILYPAKDCHSVVLMNNLASSLAQQSPRAAYEAQKYAASRGIHQSPAGPPATKESMIDNAKSWAQKALDVAAAVQPPVRTEECDIGCAVALHNLGEFAEMSQDLSLAKRKYNEAISFARAVGFDEGVRQSSARLNELSKGA